MPSLVHTLGVLEHICNSRNLKLKTGGSITISSPKAFEFPFSKNFQNLDALVSSSTWIASGNQLPIYVNILFDDIGIMGMANSDVIEDLGFVLCNAEIWSQLCLDASLSLPKNGTATKDRGLVLSLTGQPSSNAAVKPPRGVPSGCLESISLTFAFSTCRRSRISSKPQKHITAEKKLDMSLLAEPYPSRHQSDQQWESPQRSQGVSRSLGLSINEQDFLWASSRYGQTVSSPVGSQDNILSIDTRTSCTSGSSTPQYEYATHEVGFEEMLKLVDASLHTMICDRMPIKAGGLVMSHDAGYPKLATISPILFSPGYLQTISQHERLHCTIAHTMSSVYRRTRSVKLRRKMENLLGIPPNRYLEEEGGGSENPGFSSSALTTAVTARLWYLTQRKLFDPLAGRKLKSLDVLKGTRNASGASLGMLGETSESGGEDEEPFVIEEDDLLFETQNTLMAEGFGDDDGLLKDLNIMEADNLEDDLFMDGRTPLEAKIIHEDLFWEDLDTNEHASDHGWEMSEHDAEWKRYNQSNLEILDDGADHILCNQFVTESADHILEDHFERLSCQDELLEDTEMNFTS